MKKFALYFVVLIAMSQFYSVNLWAHGEDKPGPHGGVIRMPGAFHTELKGKGSSAFEVYLLDMEWKNPVVENTTLSAKWKIGEKTEVSLPCQSKTDRYLCKLPKGARFKKGDIVTLSSRRQEFPGSAVTYSYPFRSEPMKTQESHHGHH